MENISLPQLNFEVAIDIASEIRISLKDSMALRYSILAFVYVNPCQESFVSKDNKGLDPLESKLVLLPGYNITYLQ